MDECCPRRGTGACAWKRPRRRPGELTCASRLSLPPSVAAEAYLIFYERAPAAAAGAPAATPGVVDETEEVVECDDDEVEIGKDVVMEDPEGGDDPMDTT